MNGSKPYPGRLRTTEKKRKPENGRPVLRFLSLRKPFQNEHDAQNILLGDGLRNGADYRVIVNGQSAILGNRPRCGQVERFCIASLARLRVIALSAKQLRVNLFVRHVGRVGYELPAILGRN